MRDLRNSEYATSQGTLIYYEITNIELYSDPEGVDKFYTIEFMPPLEVELTSLSQNINIYNSFH